MAKKTPIQQEILDNPLYEKMISVCLDAIQELGIWHTVKEVNLPEGKGLEIGGYVRLLCKRKQFYVFYRNIQTKEWSKNKTTKKGITEEFKQPDLPSIHLNTKAKTNPTLRGRAILDTGMDWMLDYVLKKFKVEQLALDRINEKHIMFGCNKCREANFRTSYVKVKNESSLSCQEIDAKIDYIDNLISHIRRAVKNRTLRTMQKKQLEFNWLRYMSFVWKNINRDCLSALILKKFRQAVYLSDYIENQYKLKHMADAGEISKTIIPYLQNIKTGSLKKAVQLIKNGEEIPKEMTLYNSSEKPVSWKDLKDQPFSVAHAMVKLRNEDHGDFLDAWMIQPKKVRRKAHWIIQCAVDGYISANWDLGKIPKHLWKPLISLMIQLALKEKNERGYDIVVTQNWRREFFSHMSSISENWQKKPAGVIPARALTLDELISHLPMGNFRAQYELEYLEKHTAAIALPVETKKRNVRL